MRLIIVMGPAVMLVGMSVAALAGEISGGAFAPNDTLGQAVYTNCASCHGGAGQGGYGPPLASDNRLNNTEYVISHILNGSRHMPRFGEQLSGDEVAAVVNYIRNNWGNQVERISGAGVARVKNQIGADVSPPKRLE